MIEIPSPAAYGKFHVECKERSARFEEQDAADEKLKRVLGNAITTEAGRDEIRAQA